MDLDHMAMVSAEVRRDAIESSGLATAIFVAGAVMSVGALTKTTV